MPTFTHDGCDFHYEIRGDGPRVLLFNGSGASIETSAPLVNALAKTAMVLVHDQRGLGRTSVPPGPYTMAGYAADGRALLDHVGWDSCTVVGISFGGMVAQEFAVTWPGAVEKMVLMCTSAGGDAGSSYPLHELLDLPADEAFDARLRLSDSRFADAQWVESRPVESAIVEGMRAAAAAAGSKPPERLRGERLQLEARLHHDVAGRLHAVTAPVLVMAGRFDGIAPPANSEAIARLLPDAVMSVYEGGHVFSAQDRRAIEDIRRFLASGVRPD
ncbi:MAG: alpha/beta fold hydrolase [Ilumatobacteraceae bacterium]